MRRRHDGCISSLYRCNAARFVYFEPTEKIVSFYNVFYRMQLGFLFSSSHSSSSRYSELTDRTCDRRSKTSPQIAAIHDCRDTNRNQRIVRQEASTRLDIPSRTTNRLNFRSPLSHQRGHCKLSPNSRRCCNVFITIHSPSSSLLFSDLQ